MKQHDFIIATTRPELLIEQVTSFRSSKGQRRISFHVFCDDDAKTPLFENELHKLSKLVDTHVEFYSLKKQIIIIKRFAEHAHSKLGASRKDILDCFMENGKFKGIRAIQNKSILIYYLSNKDKNSIVHKLDDDIFPYDVIRKSGIGYIRQKRDFYTKKEAGIGNDRGVVAISAMTIDSPSPVSDLRESTDFLFHFLEFASKRGRNDKIGNDFNSINWTGMRRIDDSFRQIHPKPIDSRCTYDQALIQLGEHLDSIADGNSRVFLNRTNPDKKKFFYPGGGCVSFLYESTPGLMPLWGNQDLLWQLFEGIAGKKLVFDTYVSHIKIPTSRVSIIEDLKSTSYKHQTSLTYAAFRYIYLNNKEKLCVNKFKEIFVDNMDKWLVESYSFAQNTLKLLEDSNLWYLDKSKYPAVEKIRKYCEGFVNSFDSIIRNFSMSNIDASNLVDNYFAKNELFSSLIRLAKEYRAGKNEDGNPIL